MFFHQMKDEFKELFNQKGLQGLVLIARTGEVLDSWLKEDDLRKDLSILNLIESTRMLTPSLLNLPEIGFQRGLFHVGNNALLFSNVAGEAYLICLLKEEFNYIAMTVEANRAAYKIGKVLLNEKINTKELNEFLRRTYDQTSTLISLSVRTLRDSIRNQKTRENSHGSK